MGLITWIAIVVIVLVVIGLGVGVVFSGLIRGAEIVGNNPAVQNITQEAKEFLNRNIQGNSVSSNALVITTNGAQYRIGEQVAITVKNISDKTMTFSDSALSLRFQNINTGQLYGVPMTKVVTELGPGASKSLTWNQQDGKGNNVPAGDYTATVQTVPSPSSSQSVSAQVNFEITR
ncbi:MAG: hypothetical protein M3261_01220 [Thermoproteota archaeon]|nr:hypothetical protein [Thermoproteota archaeon]